MLVSFALLYNVIWYNRRGLYNKVAIFLNVLPTNLVKILEIVAKPYQMLLKDFIL